MEEANALCARWPRALHGAAAASVVGKFGGGPPAYHDRAKCRNGGGASDGQG